MSGELGVTQKFQKEKRGPVAFLIINDERYEIYAGSTKLGRSSGCDIVIDNETVSRNHAIIDIEPRGQNAFIMDLSTYNDTTINYHNIQAEKFYQIKDKDVICFGEIKSMFILKSEDDNESSSSKHRDVNHKEPTMSVVINTHTINVQYSHK